MASRTANRTAANGGASVSSGSQPVYPPGFIGPIPKGATRAAGPPSGVPTAGSKAVAKATIQAAHNNGLPVVGNAVYNDSPNVQQAPYILPGIKASQASNTYLNGRIYASIDVARNRKVNWAFRFHYNPESLSFQAQTNWNVSQPPADIGTIIGIGLETLSFSFLINRTEDVSSKRPLSRPMMGKKNFYDLGTTHDIEMLYRTINGDPQSYGTTYTGLTSSAGYDPNGSANTGLLLATAVVIQFNNIKFPCFITGLTVEHKMFSDKMVPMLSTVTIAATRYTSSLDAAPGGYVGGDGTQTAKPSTGVNPKASK